MNKSIVILFCAISMILGCKKADSSKRESVNDPIAFAVKAFKLDEGRLPTEEEGLAVLLHPPATGGKPWRGPYLKLSDREISRYKYIVDKNAKDGFRIISLPR